MGTTQENLCNHGVTLMSFLASYATKHSMYTRCLRLVARTFGNTVFLGNLGGRFAEAFWVASRGPNFEVCAFSIRQNYPVALHSYITIILYHESFLGPCDAFIMACISSSCCCRSFICSSSALGLRSLQRGLCNFKQVTKTFVLIRSLPSLRAQLTHVSSQQRHMPAAELGQAQTHSPPAKPTAQEASCVLVSASAPRTESVSPWLKILAKLW